MASPAIAFLGDVDGGDGEVPSNGTTPATDGGDDDYQEAFGGRQLAMACLALFAWGLLAFIFVRSFIRAEAHREKLLHFWRVVATTPEIKAAVERAAGGSDTVPEPPRSGGCLKFLRVALVGLFLVISLQLFLGLALAPLDVVVESDDVSDEYYPQGPAVLFFFLVILFVILVVSTVDARGSGGYFKKNE